MSDDNDKKSSLEQLAIIIRGIADIIKAIGGSSQSLTTIAIAIGFSVTLSTVTIMYVPQVQYALLGPQGEPGPQGVQGLQGNTGDVGPEGPIGLTGEQGIQGLQGWPGIPGEQGIQGEKGYTGDIGPQGIQGVKGDTGETGPQGPPGVNIIEYNNIGSVLVITDTPRNLGSVTLSVPTNGYVHLIATGVAIIFGDNTACVFGLGTTAGATDLYYTRGGVLDGTGSQRREFSLTPTAIVYVTPGSHTFYATAYRPSVFSSYQVNLGDVYLIAVFYGDVTGISMPELISPANGTVFSHYPRETTLKWTSVPGASKYMLERDIGGYADGPWEKDITGESFYGVIEVNTNSYTFNFVGAQPGRWRVWAVNVEGIESTKTSWWEFLYTR